MLAESSLEHFGREGHRAVVLRQPLSLRLARARERRGITGRERYVRRGILGAFDRRCRSPRDALVRAVERRAFVVGELERRARDAKQRVGPLRIRWAKRAVEGDERRQRESWRGRFGSDRGRGDRCARRTRHQRSSGGSVCARGDDAEKECEWLQDLLRGDAALRRPR
jgi:hypothetical protein